MRQAKDGTSIKFNVTESLTRCRGAELRAVTTRGLLPEYVTLYDRIGSACGTLETTTGLIGQPADNDDWRKRAEQAFQNIDDAPNYSESELRTRIAARQ